MDNQSKKDDSNGFSIIEEMNGNRPYLTWHRTLIIKLLGKGIGYKALESILYQLWAKKGILDIIDLTNILNLVKFNNYSNYEYALIGDCSLFIIITL